MTIPTHAHDFTNWAKERLAEIDATVTWIEGRFAALRDDAKAQAEKAVSELKAQREPFLKAIREQQDQSEAAWTKVRGDLASNWTAFESTVQRYLADASHAAEQQQAVFRARAEAQRKVWQQSIEAFIEQAGSFAAAKRKDLDAAVSQVKTEAETAKSRLDTVAKAGEQSWDALRLALEESRAAFDKASKKALDAFKHAG